jgi:dimethylaniline monooxygenase (N-oxide forming)
LYFIGLVQPIGAIMPVAEAQSQWVADLLEGRAALPPEPEMNRKITRYRTATARRYARSGSDAIHVDFLPYLREIRKERTAGARRSRDRRALLEDHVLGSSRKHTSVRRLAGSSAQSP